MIFFFLFLLFRIFSCPHLCETYVRAGEFLVENDRLRSRRHQLHRRCKRGEFWPVLRMISTPPGRKFRITRMIETPYDTDDSTLPGRNFRATFLESKWSTRNEEGGFGKISTRSFHKRPARGLHFFSPLSRKSAKKFARWGVLSSVLCAKTISDRWDCSTKELSNVYRLFSLL